jgi:hypothetical protein
MKADFLPPSVVDIQEKEAICASSFRAAPKRAAALRYRSSSTAEGVG